MTKFEPGSVLMLKLLEQKRSCQNVNLQNLICQCLQQLDIPTTSLQKNFA